MTGPGGVGTEAGSFNHPIRWGDTLSEIAAANGTTVEALASANGIVDPDLIYAGGTLRVTPGAGGSGGHGGAMAAFFMDSPDVMGGTVRRSGTSSWMNIAYDQVGQREIPGGGTNPFISACHASTTLGRANDDVPWCSSFVNWVMEQAGYRGTDNAMAVSWSNWGDNVGSLDQARTGDIVVLRGPQSHHVGFLVRASDGSVTLLGGNQSDTVKESTFGLGTYDIVAIRRPPQAV